jgi:CRISPR-associated endonuclease Cas1/CRISPR-associated protein Cas4
VEDLLNGDPLLRVMSLHALAYCERLFYLEEVEEIRVADERVYEGRIFHESIPDYSGIEQLTLRSERLGIYGKVDVVRTYDGKAIPYEYKKGRSRSENGTPEAWPSDELQLAAYIMLVEEAINEPVNEGRIYYAAEHRTVKVFLTDALRNRVVQAISRANELRLSPYRPPVASNDRLCPRCSLAPVCLPEEERLLKTPERETVRLFPEDRDKLDLHVVDPGSTIRKKGDQLIIEKRSGESQSVPVHQLGSVSIHGYSQITTQMLHFCSHQGIHVHWFTSGGRYIGSLANSAGAVQRKWRQYNGLRDETLRLKLAKALTKAKIDGQLRYMLRLTRNSDKRSLMKEHLGTLRTMLKQVNRADRIESLLGYEGTAARSYFACLSILTDHDSDQGMNFRDRNRRPPKDAPNALLSFLYALLYKECVQAVLTVGLDPVIGFYHQPRSSAYPLALDLMELFRVPLCDAIMIGSIGRKQWSLEEDFVQGADHVWLSESGKKKAIALFERRKQDTWKHPVIGYSLTYARLIELEVRLLEKEWSGNTGLFAQNRLR